MCFAGELSCLACSVCLARFHLPAPDCGATTGRQFAKAHRQRLRAVCASFCKKWKKNRNIEKGCDHIEASFLSRAASLLLACVMLLLCCPCAYAHPASVQGGESVGWDINKYKHFYPDKKDNNGALTYTYASDMPQKYRSYIAAGASKWSSVVNIINSATGTVYGEIRLEDNGANSEIAAFDGAIDSSGHLTSWIITINSYYEDEINARTLAHEFGHAIGLKDLYKSSNANKIMYGYTSSSWTATGVTSADRWGAKVITGQHTSHSMSYKYNKTDSAGNNYHVKYCTDCGGLASSAVKCTYNSNNRCKLCGTPKGAQTSSLVYLLK